MSALFHRRPEAAPVAPMERVISVVLRAGVLLAAAIICWGVIALAVTRSTGYAPIVRDHLSLLFHFRLDRGPAFFPTTVPAVLAGVAHGRPYAIIALGLLVLIATPVLRVALSAVFFAVERDWVYTAITLLVLVVLVGGFLLGAG
jgi:uncharacterized membrane protein